MRLPVFTRLSLALGFAFGLSGLSSIAVPSAVLAQEQSEAAETEAAEAVEDAVDAAEAEVAEAEVAEAVPAADDIEEDVSKGKAKFPRISDDEETIYAVQRKAYLTKNKWELTPMFGIGFNDDFVQTLAPGASIVYHAAETFGIELYGAYMFPSESALTEEIRFPDGFSGEVAKLTQMLWTANVGVQWSPIYGKVHIFDQYLGNFAFYIGAGLGVGQFRVSCVSSAQLDPNRGFSPDTCPVANGEEFVYEPARFALMGNFSGGIRFNFSNSIGLKIEVRDIIYSARVFQPPGSSTNPNQPTGGTATQPLTDAIRNNVFAQIGISFLLGGEDN